MIVALADLLSKLSMVGPIKRHAAVNQCIEQDPQSPAVHLTHKKTQSNTELYETLTMCYKHTYGKSTLPLYFSKIHNVELNGNYS